MGNERKKTVKLMFAVQGQQGSNPQPAVLETATLPIELCPCLDDLLGLLIC